MRLSDKDSAWDIPATNSHMVSPSWDDSFCCSMNWGRIKTFFRQSTFNKINWSLTSRLTNSNKRSSGHETLTQKWEIPLPKESYDCLWILKVLSFGHEIQRVSQKLKHLIKQSIKLNSWSNGQFFESLSTTSRFSTKRLFSSRNLSAGKDVSSGYAK